MTELLLVSHALCPYVQRTAIALDEKRVPFRRIDIDLSAKPDWFARLSPLGKTPVLKVGEDAIFESAVILEYLEETQPNPLHPTDPLERARHRGWIEVASTILAAIASLYNAPDSDGFARARDRLRTLFERVEDALGDGPWFAGDRFSLVDAAFAPVFRYFDVMDRFGSGTALDGLAGTAAWRQALAGRPSVRAAAAPDYPDRLSRFLEARRSHISSLMAARATPA